MNRLQKAAAFGAMMGKRAGDEVATPPTYDERATAIRNDSIARARAELERKGQMARDAAGGQGAYGTSTATMKGGDIVQGTAKFTPQGGNRPALPAVPGAGGQANSPPIPRGMQPVPPASSPVIESKPPKRLF
jgi:hypothetical protein